MKHCFIINPASGKATTKEGLENRIRQACEAAGAECFVLTTERKGDAPVYIKDFYDEHGSDDIRFYACGGDGTLNEVVNGAVGFPQASVGCYPCGSGNDFVKYYGGVKNFLDLDAQINATEEEIDLMRVGNKYAINATHFGFDSSVAKTMMNVRRKKIIGGKNAYTTGVVVGLLRAMVNPCKVSVDGELLNPKGKILLCTIANGQYVGGSFRCAPRSVDNDGLLEVCLVHPVSHFTFMKLIKFYTNGEHLGNPKFDKHLEYRRGKRIEIEAPEGFLYSFDGELIRQNRFTVEVVPRAIRFAVPKGAKPIVDPAHLPKEEKEIATV